ncbi:MAG: 2-C-methyl-D-erythritol 4-phosphate cytidylyltransferase [Bacteroidetes bacterium]|nr:2-C-methyl-D-erythritol 4-phosphate cytidylyltransferase [Bacteroidota bacterium]
MNPWTLIVPSGGIGSRMATERPKQYLEIGQQPIILHTLMALDLYFDSPQFIVALETPWMEFLTDHLAGLDLQHRCRLVEGGKERYNSVKNALQHVTTPLVGVHDAVRPFVSQETVNRIKTAITTNDAVIPVVPLRDSLRKRFSEASVAVQRSEFMSVQTPQCFRSKVLEKAYLLEFDASITDDASLVERDGIAIYSVQGNEENIKITTPLDFILAQHLISQR